MRDYRLQELKHRLLDWVKEIQSFRDFKRYSRIEELRKAGFDEKDVAKYFQDFYLNILDKL